jgi:hypothetical protein
MVSGLFCAAQIYVAIVRETFGGCPWHMSYTAGSYCIHKEKRREGLSRCHSTDVTIGLISDALARPFISAAVLQT